MKVQIFHSFTPELCEAWYFLEQNGYASPFQSLGWLRCWYESNTIKSSKFILYITVLYDDDLPLAIFPFIRKKVFLYNSIEFLGQSYSDYCGPIIHNKFSNDINGVKILWEHCILSLPPPYIINIIKISKTDYYILSSIFVTNLKCIFSDAYSANLPSTFNEFLKKLPTKFKSDTARSLRNLSKVATVNFVVSDDLKFTSKLIDIAIKYKISRLKSQGKINYLNDEKIINFYKLLPYYLNSVSKIHASALLVDENFVAIHIGILQRGIFYYVFPAFQDGIYTKYSPGRILLWSLVEKSILDGCTKFDFTLGGEEYKSIWCNQVEPLFYIITSKNFLLYNLSKLLSIKYYLKSNKFIIMLATSFFKVIYFLKIYE